MPDFQQHGNTKSPALLVTVRTDGTADRDYSFNTPFKIGRIEECDLWIKNDYVSRVHASVSFENGAWWLCDLGSSNGIFVNGIRLQRVQLKDGVTARLGISGPELRFRNQLPVGRTSQRSIFINYRRQDSEGEAGRLFDDLSSFFGPNSVFMDVAGIAAGQDFRKAIDKSVASCSVLLAIMGPAWLDARDGSQRRRLDDAGDFVRMELSSALSRDIPVVPVLVRAARMPTSDQLPDNLKDLAFRNALELTHARWKSDVKVLLQALQPYIDLPSGIAAPLVSASVDRGAAFDGSLTTMGAESHPERAAYPAILDEEKLDQISKELARFIGPISKVLVKRAAKQCSSPEDLLQSVAAEIEAEVDRSKFLKTFRG